MLFLGNPPELPADDAPVLVIDEQPDGRVRELTARRFARWGYAVLVAPDAAQALSLCDEIIPALVVLGELDPATDASNLLHEIKAILGEFAPPISVLIGAATTDATTADISVAPPIPIEDLLDFADDLCAA